MSIEAIINEVVEDTITARNFIETWYFISDILVSFSKATDLPISIYLRNRVLFNSPLSSMPSFCQKMNDLEETRQLCTEDALKRAKKDFSSEKLGKYHLQMCHAGMINAKREIETDIGVLTILFGYKPSNTQEALKRREHIIENLKKSNLPAPIEEMISISKTYESAPINTGHLGFTDENKYYDSHDLLLMDSITKIIKLVLKLTIDFRARTTNLAHELVVMFVGLVFMSQETTDALKEIQEIIPKNLSVDLSETIKLQESIEAETTLCNYVVQNYLSQSNEHRYNEINKPHLDRVNLLDLILDMTQLYTWQLKEKNLKIDVEIDDLPIIWGNKMELRRAFHNVLNNAVKYSYHSVEALARLTERVIKIKCKVPYDPGFRKERFAVLIENYGLGLTAEERRHAFDVGFRGTQAKREVVVGSGIGLSEVNKIMKFHQGAAKLSSKRLHGEGVDATYLTTVSLIFPFTFDFNK